MKLINLLLTLFLLVIVGCSLEAPARYTGVTTCPDYTCTATNASGVYCALSSSGYRAYPSEETTVGYKDCINRTTSVKGTWNLTAIDPEETLNETFTRDRCVWFSNVTMCIKSSDPVENDLFVEQIANASVES